MDATDLSGFSVSAGASSMTSPSKTSFVSLTRSPADQPSRAIARRTDRATEVLHQHLGLLDLVAVHLRPDHRTERRARPELVRHRQRQRRLARRRTARKQQRTAGEALCPNEVEHDAAGLPWCELVRIVRNLAPSVELDGRAQRQTNRKKAHLSCAALSDEASSVILGVAVLVQA